MKNKRKHPIYISDPRGCKNSCHISFDINSDEQKQKDLEEKLRRKRQ